MNRGLKGGMLDLTTSEDEQKLALSNRQLFDELTELPRRAELAENGGFFGSGKQMGVLAAGLRRRAQQAIVEGHWTVGLQLLESSLGLLRQLDDRSGRAETIFLIGRVQQLMSNPDQARTRYRDAWRLHEAEGDQAGVAACQAGLGALAVQQGLTGEGRGLLAEARRYYAAAGQPQRLAEIDEILGLIEQAAEAVAV